MRSQRLLCAWVAASLAGPGLAAPQEPVRLEDHVRFLRADRTVLAPGERAGWEIEIDEDIDIQWSEQEKLLAELRARLPVKAPPEALRKDIDALSQVASLLVEVQQTFDRAAEARLSGREDEATVLETRAAAMAIPQLESLKPMRDRAPRLYEKIKTELLGRIQDRYRRVASVLSDELESTALELDASAVELQILMEAYVAEPGGVEEPVRVKGYFELKDRRRYSFERFQKVIDERTKRDLDAAEQVANRVQPLLDDGARRALQSELRELGRALKDFVEMAGSETLETHLDAMLTKLRGAVANDPDVQATLQEVEGLIAMLRSLRVSLAAMQPETISDFVAAFEAIQRSLESLRRSLESLPGTATALFPKIRSLVQAQAGLLGVELKEKLEASLAALEPKLSKLTAMRAQIEHVLSKLGIGAALTPGVQAVRRTARELNAFADLSTTIVTESAKERRPGDRLRLRIWIHRKGALEGDAPLADEDYSFRLRVLGWYTEFRGGVIFADPRGGSVAAGQDYEVAPALAYHLKYGFEKNSFWNDVLSPGLGISFALLDFEEESDLEVGLGANLSLFHDLLWAGYGRNLQAEVDYFYVGLNPLAVADLFRGKGAFEKR